MKKNTFYQLLPFCISGIISFLIVGFLTKSDITHQSHLPESAELALILLTPAITFFAALYVVFRPKISLENLLLWIIAFISLHTFTYFATFYAILRVSLANEYYSFLVGATTSSISALIAVFVLNKTINLKTNPTRIFFGGILAWGLANAIQLIKMSGVEIYFYGFASIYLFWQLAIGYECISSNKTLQA